MTGNTVYQIGEIVPLDLTPSAEDGGGTTLRMALNCVGGMTSISDAARWTASMAPMTIMMSSTLPEGGPVRAHTHQRCAQTVSIH